MKKISYLLVGLTTMLFCINTTKAMTINNDGTMTNERGSIITKEQYEILLKYYNDATIDNLKQNIVDLMGNANSKSSTKEEYYITTYTLDKYDNVVDTITIKATKEDAENVANNANLHVMPNGKLQDVSNLPSIQSVVDNYKYETGSKIIRINYGRGVTDNQEMKYVISLEADWYTIPKVKSFDVLAVRWDNSVTVFDTDGVQLTDAGRTEYSTNGKNTKKTSKGVGISMNLYDDAKTDIHLTMFVISDNSFGYNVYGTYQHAVNNISLATSQSYTFGSSGLGGVLVYSNGYSKYFDNMTGLKWHYEF